MISYHKEVRAALQTILPTHYELSVDSKTTTPCITYQEFNNFDIYSGDNVYFGVIQYVVKIWSNSVEDLALYSSQVDTKMKTLGFRRVSANELFSPTSMMGQKILRYEANTTDFL